MLKHPVLRILGTILCLTSAETAAQSDARADRLASMRRIMPVGAICAELEWEPVSYCKFHSQGATLEIWSGLYGPGATLSFDGAGDVGLILMTVIREHFRLAGIAVEKLDQCIRKSATFSIEGADKIFELHCHLVNFASSLSLEIYPEPGK